MRIDQHKAPSSTPAPGKPAARLNQLERSMAVIEHRLADIEDRNSQVPNRVTRLESQFEHMAGQLVALNNGQRQLTETVANIGGKVTRMMTILTVLGVLAQMVAPTLLKLVLP